MPATRHLYLARHANADPTTGDLTDTGRRQAPRLGHRLSALTPRALHHGPLPRATQTAHLVADHLPGIHPHPTPEAGDYIPHIPTRQELPPEHADRILDFVHAHPATERDPALAHRALSRFTGPTDGDHDVHDIVITHAYLVGRIVCAALGAPAWTWTALAPANAALTVIRYAPDRAPALLTFNDVSHLDPDLRWTGFPPHLTP
ncbi:histidine phosphatase family protein [Nocardiopsis sp. FIRDI 009]|uniref:histidine phosphatase family protein n=1 Tax=Nocardiopsis sp. FIRDI 009 TaxID=714197 RepID=UPI000E269F27|nr:histidine phosphatase family protein [Nocardiopsis sp. FIRDI 009]